MTLRRSLTGLLCLVFPLVISGCGGGNAPPPSGSMTISPPSTSWTVGATNPPVYEMQFQPFLVVVKDANGIPLKGVSVILSLGLSAGTSTNALMTIYLTDPTTGQPTTPITTPTDVTTNSSGTINLWVGMETGGTLNYSGNLFVYSGALQTSASLSVVCKAGTSVPCS